MKNFSIFLIKTVFSSNICCFWVLLFRDYNFRVSALNQKTIKEKINFSGVGLHSGQNVNICVKPSTPDTGIVFKRVDINDNNLIFPNFSK